MTRIEEIREIRAKIKRYEDAIEEAVINGASSATISSGGASNSYTRYSLADMRAIVVQLKRRLYGLLTMRPTPYRRTSPNFQM